MVKKELIATEGINNYIKEYRKGLDLFYDITVYLKNSQITVQEDIFFANGIGFKIYYHFITILKIITESKSEIKTKTFLIDNASLDVLTRASFETYLTFNYLFIQSDNPDVRVFRFNCWDLNGYCNRLNYTYIPKNQKNRMKCEEKKRKRLQDTIKASPCFRILDSDTQGKILSGNWRGKKSWVDLAIEAGFNKNLFRDIYSCLCSEAHCSRVSITNIFENLNATKNRRNADATIGFALMIMAKFIVDFCKVMHIPNEIINNHKDVWIIILKWKKIAETANYSMIKNMREFDS